VKLIGEAFAVPWDMAILWPEGLAALIFPGHLSGSSASG
jgi:hypothetical protein